MDETSVDAQDLKKIIAAEAVRAFTANIADIPLEGAGDTQSGNLTWKTLISNDRTPSNQMTLAELRGFDPD